MLVAQFSSLWYMCPGIHLMLFACSTMSSCIFVTATNHCFLVMISIGVLHLQQRPTFWSTSSCLIRNPSSLRSFIIAFLHSFMVMPSYLPATSSISPFSLIALITSKSYLVTHSTSVLSPNVHIITTPVPYSGSTDSSVIIVTSLL